MANIKLSQLNPGAPTEDTDLFFTSQDAVTTPLSRKITGADLKTYFSFLDTLNVLTIVSLDNTEVNLENTYFSSQANNVLCQLGRSSAGTNSSELHLQGKKNANFFLESDTDAVGAHDDSVFAMVVHASDIMFRIDMPEPHEAAAIEVGNKNGAITPVDLIISTGGDYGTPVTGEIPNYVGGGKVAPIPAITVSGTDQSVTLHADLGVGTTSRDASALVQIDSVTQGVLGPRMTTAQRNAISAPAEGLEVYDLDLHQKFLYNGTSWVSL